MGSLQNNESRQQTGGKEGDVTTKAPIRSPYATIYQGERLLRKARLTLEDAFALLKNGITIDELRAALGPLTAGSEAFGQPLGYAPTHRIFTCLNQFAGGGFDRYEFVWCRDSLEEGSRPYQDPALQECLVFPGLRRICQKRKLRPNDVADWSEVPFDTIEEMIEGKPVPKAVANAVFWATLEQVPELVEEEELFP